MESSLRYSCGSGSSTPGGDLGWQVELLLAHQKRTRALGVTEPDRGVQHFVPAILDSRKPDFQPS